MSSHVIFQPPCESPRLRWDQIPSGFFTARVTSIHSTQPIRLYLKLGDILIGFGCPGSDSSSDLSRYALGNTFQDYTEVDVDLVVKGKSA